MARSVRIALMCVLTLTAGAVWGDESAKNEPAAEGRRFSVETLRGKIVWLGEAMQRLHGVQWVAEARQREVALETADGQLIPIVEDVRGRGFRNDERLRGIEMELLVRRYRGVPAVQVLSVFAMEKDGKYELDYWCGVCAIAMFELKPCECCQADTELRRRKVK